MGWQHDFRVTDAFNPFLTSESIASLMAPSNQVAWLGHGVDVCFLELEKMGPINISSGFVLTIVAYINILQISDQGVMVMGYSRLCMSGFCVTLVYC